MKRTALVVFLMMAGSAYTFATDGQVLINMSTVNAAGGFPYRITQSGSYKLSGNLTPPRNVTAIRIEAPYVSLDLGGFSIGCEILLTGLSDPLPCILGISNHTSIRNGMVAISENPAFGTSSKLYVAVGPGNDGSIEDLIVDESLVLSPNVEGIFANPRSIVLRNIVLGPNTVSALHVECPSVVAHNYADSMLLELIPVRNSPCAAESNALR
jgi:hypothetical protein